MSRPGLAAQDGMISVLLAMSMALFLVLLAAVIDLGQLQGARTSLASATSSAAQRAGTVLARQGCAEFALARAAADAALLENAQTATIVGFEVRYGVVPVASAADCTLVVDDNVGQVQVTTADSREPIFSASFTSAGLTTSASTTVEWGYVTAMAGGLRPLSLCTQHPAYQDYQTYLAQVAAYEAAPSPATLPDATLVDPFDIEVDAFRGSTPDPVTGVPETGFCEDNSMPPVAHRYGDLVSLDFSGSKRTSTSAALRAEIADWLEGGAPWLISLDDALTGVNEASCGDNNPNDVGGCEGVASGNSTNMVGPLLPLMDSVFTIALHDTPQCRNGNDYSFCSGSGADRSRRMYPITGFARVELLCARITAYPTIADAAVPDPDPLSPTYGSDCVGLQKAAFVDNNPGDDVFVRLRFVPESTIGEGHLSATPVADRNFLGISVCAVDGDDNCRF